MSFKTLLESMDTISMFNANTNKDNGTKEKTNSKGEILDGKDVYKYRESEE